MEETKEKITTLQSHLNRLIIKMGSRSYSTAPLYTLSVELDKEIVKYYKDIYHS